MSYILCSVFNFYTLTLTLYKICRISFVVKMSRGGGAKLLPKNFMFTENISMNLVYTLFSC